MLIVYLELFTLKLFDKVIINLEFPIEEPGFFIDKSGFQNLQYLYGINHNPDKKKILNVLESVSLGNKKWRKNI